MHWQPLEPKSLITDYGAWILPNLLGNNRVISLLGLAEANYKKIPGASVWAFRDSNDQLMHILAHTPREIALVLHEDLPILPLHVASIYRQFPGPWVITCHGEQCRDWEASAKGLGYKDVPLLSTWLYYVDPKTLRDEPLANGLQFKRLAVFDKHIGRFISGFMWDALGQKIAVEDLKNRFESQTFYGLFQAEKLLSIAAATRRSLGSRCISYVYTPPKCRGQGYASMLVSRLSHELFLQPDLNFVFLYADQTNPFSNRVYQKLGYQALCESKTF